MKQLTSPAASRYEIVSLPGTKLTAIAELRRQMLGEGFASLPDDAVRAEWLYANNPAGPAEILALRDQIDGWVGMVAIIPRQIWIDGAERDGAYLCDFFVHPAHRTLLPALSLQRAAKQRLLDTGRVNYAIPNERSLPIFARLGAEQILQRLRWSRPIRSKPFLVRKGIGFPLLLVSHLLDAVSLAYDRVHSTQSQGIRAEWAADFDRRFDDLWSSVAETGVSIGERSARFLRWRFLEEPGHENRILCLTEMKTGRLIGYLIGEITQGGFFCRDLLIATSRRGEAGVLSRAALAVRVLGVTGISVRVVGPDDLMRALYVAGFRQRDPESVFIRNVPTGIHGPWYLTTSDEDV